MLSCFTGFPFCSLLCNPLLGELLFLCLFSAVKLHLLPGFLLDPAEGLGPVWMGRRSQSGKTDQPLPGAKPLRQVAAARHFQRPGGVSVKSCPIPDQLQKLFVRVLPMLLPELLLLGLQSLGDHTADGCFINILSSRITHDFVSLNKKTAAVMISHHCRSCFFAKPQSLFAHRTGTKKRF